MEASDFKLESQGAVRVRIPPAPTGLMHIGTARMALFNYLYAKQHNGAIVFRVENTDRERSKPEFVSDIIEGLKWLGLSWDEGPFFQTQRTAIYADHLRRLLDEGKAYWCFCPPEALEAEKQYRMSQGEPPVYSGACAAIPLAEAEKRIAAGERAVVRFRTTIKKVEFKDAVRGELEFDSALIGDFVIAKDLDNALYNFVSVVDDALMNITHVIRGEDVLPNTPKQILIQEALGFARPFYAHLPLILGPDRNKLSKRHGAVSLNEYRRQGYLPEAMINFMAFLGWNPGTEKEIYSISSLVKEFSLERIQKGGAIFNVQRLDYLNGFYIRNHAPDAIAEMCVPYLVAAGLIEEKKEALKRYIIKATGEEVGFDFLKKIVLYHQQRLKKLSEIAELADFFFARKLALDKDLLVWKEARREDVAAALDEVYNLLSKIEAGEWGRENLKRIIMEKAEAFARNLPITGADRGYFLWPLRVALCGKKNSISPFEIADALGKEKTLARIKGAADLL